MVDNSLKLNIQSVGVGDNTCLKLTVNVKDIRAYDSVTGEDVTAARISPG